MIKLNNVKKTFNRHKKNKIEVINNTSLEFSSPGLVCFLGPSGCGKTTLLNVIGGLDKVNSGRIYIDGKKITKVTTGKIDKIRNMTIGYIFQDYKLIENMTVFENVALVLRMIGIKDKKEIEKRVLYTLDKVNMLRYKRRPVTMLSGGERQRVGIARALVKNPKIIIADEPTGNLDSRNSIEIMNIIKKISKTKLVILVTHEEELAKFYGNRIIILKDGKVIDDYENNETRTLDYQVENKIYLKDFDNHEILKKDNININVYSNEEENIKLDIVFKNGNIYIKSNSSDKLEAVENNIELINEHYKKIKETDSLEDNFDIDSISNKKYKEKYSSIFRLGSFIIAGFKNILDYPVIKKLLLIGFFLSGLFIFYAVSSSFASLDIQDKDFVKINSEYLTANVKNIKLDDYLSFEENPNTKIIMPGDSKVNFILKFDSLYQTSTNSDTLEGSLSDINMISEKDLIDGVMPQNDREIVVDKMALTTVNNKGIVSQIGVKKANDFINIKVYLNILGDFKIVGITDKQQPNIYAYKQLFTDIISNSKQSDNNMDKANDVSEANFINYIYNQADYKLIKGNLPLNDYEIIVSSIHETEMPLNKVINTKVNGKKLKVVGYFKGSKEYENYYLTNEATVKYNLITNKNNITVLSNNKTGSKNDFLAKNIKLQSSYKSSKDQYLNDQKDSIKKTLILCSIIMIISLLEILLMIRSSFLSRVKEVGIYRAVGVKKSDIYKMFVGEIIGITSTASLSGILFMAYILHNLNNIKYINGMFMVNFYSIIASIIIVYVFNIVVGLFPVYTTMRKTPAQILSRQDVN